MKNEETQNEELNKTLVMRSTFSNVLTETHIHFCEGCEMYTDKKSDEYGFELCDDCNDIYDNKTGYCSLGCCLGGGCDEAC